MLRDNPQWLVTAHTLGLALHGPGSYVDGASFARLKRSMRGPADRAPNTKQWMYGTWPVPGSSARVEVLVLVDLRNVGSSSYIETHTVARVTPPLFYGLTLSSQNWLSKALAPVPGIGDVRFDDAFRFDALDPTRARQLFTPHVVAHMLPMSALYVRVCDSSVDIRSDGVELDPLALTRRLNTAAVVAAALSARRREIPTSEGEVALAERWARFAGAEGFAFDAPRLRIDGQVGALATRVALEGEPKKLSTVLSARLPMPLGIGLRLSEQSALSFLAELFGQQDIVVGDPPFDQKFIVQGQEAAVRAVLASPELRRGLHSLVLGADDFTIDDARVIVRWPCVFEPSQLASVVEHVRLIGRGLVHGPPRQGAYR
ncbi:MAG: hypothetical protein KC657_34605 [Myxococcales bacterium]|nr:hypothetical protein [Myxococcales bacterium]